MQASSIFLSGRRIIGVDAGGFLPPLILEIMMMATRRNDEDDNAIRRHFSFKLEGLTHCIILPVRVQCSLVAEGFT